MKKLAAVVFILTLVVVGLYSNNKKVVKTEMTTSNEVVTGNVDNVSYIDYVDGVLNKGGEKKVLFFYANWCPTCKSADKSFRNDLNKIPDDITVYRVNYNDSDTDKAEKELAKKYGITYQHTFVLTNSSGDILKKWNGGEVEELINKAK